MVAIKIFLDKRRGTKEDTYPLNYRIYHSGKSTTRSAKIYLRDDQWDAKKKLVRNNHPESKLLNKRLLKDYPCIPQLNCRSIPLQFH
ncbi:Arm DNA-binding domain-containing protein [Pedobacter steynii]